MLIPTNISMRKPYRLSLRRSGYQLKEEHPKIIKSKIWISLSLNLKTVARNKKRLLIRAEKKHL